MLLRKFPGNKRSLLGRLAFVPYRGVGYSAQHGLNDALGQCSLACFRSLGNGARLGMGLSCGITNGFCTSHAPAELMGTDRFIVRQILAPAMIKYGQATIGQADGSFVLVNLKLLN